jgi:hypothetical protein
LVSAVCYSDKLTNPFFVNVPACRIVRGQTSLKKNRQTTSSANECSSPMAQTTMVDSEIGNQTSGKTPFRWSGGIAHAGADSGVQDRQQSLPAS